MISPYCFLKLHVNLSFFRIGVSFEMSVGDVGGGSEEG